MIFGNIHKLDEYSFLEENILRGLRYALENDILPLEKGRHDIDGDQLYFNVAEYTTAPAEEKKYEAHKAYIDVHYLMKGTERIDVAFVSNMEQGEYEAEGDYLPVSGTPVAGAVMVPGDFLVCYPEDGHCPGIQVRGPEAIKKAIFKVLL